MAATMVAADTYTASSGNTLTDLISKSYARIRATTSGKVVTINVEQYIVTSADLAANEEVEFFICFAR